MPGDLRLDAVSTIMLLTAIEAMAGSNETPSWYTFGDKTGTRRVASGAKSMTYPVPESGGTAGGVSENI